MCYVIRHLRNILIRWAGFQQFSLYLDNKFTEKQLYIKTNRCGLLLRILVNRKPVVQRSEWTFKQASCSHQAVSDFRFVRSKFSPTDRSHSYPRLLCLFPIFVYVLYLFNSKIKHSLIRPALNLATPRCSWQWCRATDLHERYINCLHDNDCKQTSLTWEDRVTLGISARIHPPAMTD